MKVADFLFHALMREQNPFVDLSNKQEKILPTKVYTNLSNNWNNESCLCSIWKHKLEGRGYGLLPKREVWIAPWEEVAINLIGPWKVNVNGQQVELNALICIDMTLNLVKLIRIDNKTAEHIRNKLTQSWLCQYPCPV